MHVYELVSALIKAKAMSLRAIRGTQRLTVLPVIDAECTEGEPATQHVTINVLVMPSVHVAPEPAPAELAAPRTRTFRRELAAYDAPADTAVSFKTVC